MSFIRSTYSSSTCKSMVTDWNFASYCTQTLGFLRTTCQCRQNRAVEDKLPKRTAILLKGKRTGRSRKVHILQKHRIKHRRERERGGRSRWGHQSLMGEKQDAPSIQKNQNGDLPLLPPERIISTVLLPAHERLSEEKFRWIGHSLRKPPENITCEEWGEGRGEGSRWGHRISTEESKTPSTQ